MPGQRAAEGGLHSEIQAAVSRAERADHRRARDGGLHVIDSEPSGSGELLLGNRREVEREQRSWSGGGRPGAAWSAA
ncbi:hypothetical protein ACFWP5_04495 [Streptomyces sp. NPDC058469]|uniref:hypothetical protein n=1 Tax=Streptomyces sp. NPDC058469 TaxID=3346514 RepID=UPI00364D9067